MKKVARLTVRKPNHALTTFNFADDAAMNQLAAGEYEVFVRRVEVKVERDWRHEQELAATERATNGGFNR